MAAIALASAAAIAAAYSANLFSFFVVVPGAYARDVPTGCAWRRGEGPARGATYLATLLVSSVGLFLPAMVWTYAIAGTLEFRPGGMLAGHVDPLTANILLALFVFGLAKIAPPPLHRWLSASSVAPYPALVSIQALAVLPAGGVGLLKISAYVFGAALHQAEIAARLLLILVGATMCVAALIALSSRICASAWLIPRWRNRWRSRWARCWRCRRACSRRTLQIVALACASATLLMAAGSVHAATGRRDAKDYAGLGQLMPWTFAAFALGSASMIGMPPFSGAWANFGS